MVVQSNTDYAQQTREILSEEFGKEPMIELEFGPVVGTHIGPGTLAVLFKLK